MIEKENFRILVINPTIESTMIAVYENDHCLYEKTIVLKEEMLDRDILSQIEVRKRSVLQTIHAIGLDMTNFAAVCGRGGLLRPIEGGTYLVNSKMINDLLSNQYGKHVSNLGAVLARSIAKEWNLDAFIVDPVVVDEMTGIAKKTGVPNIERKSIFHALNQKSAGRILAKQLNRKYKDLSLIIAHVGGGTTVGAHQYGRVIDVNNGFDGDGPFSFERSGSIPNHSLIQLCCDSSLTKENIEEKLISQSGLKAYLGLERQKDLDDLMQRNPEQVNSVFNILAYQIAKEIGKMSTVLAGNVDAIILTGHLVKWEYLVQPIMDKVSWIADVHTIPGENVMFALSQGTLRVLEGKEEWKQY